MYVCVIVKEHINYISLYSTFLRERARKDGLGEQLDVLCRSELVKLRACSCMAWGMLPDINRMVDLTAISSGFGLLPVSSSSSSTFVRLGSFFFRLLSISSCLCFSSWTSWSFFRVFFFSMQVSYYPFSFYICIYVGEIIDRSTELAVVGNGVELWSININT